MSNVPPSVGKKPGAAAFGNLRAEDEPWLADCFVPPANFETIIGNRSLVVFGRPGSGKTAIVQYLRQLIHPGTRLPHRLLARWLPSPLQSGEVGGPTAIQTQANQIFDACVDALLSHLARFPAQFQAAPPLAQESLIWFVQRYSQTNLEARLEQAIFENKPAQPEILQNLLSPPRREILRATATPLQVANHLARTINALGLQGVWIIVDDLDMWVDVARDELVANLYNFLSTLPLFEQTHFCYKLFLPFRLEQPLSRASGLLTRRVEAHYLHWDSKNTLQQIVEKRLALATGQPDFTIARLVAQPQDLLEWLNLVGANSPREWLEQTRPLLEHYLATNATTPIDAEAWQTLRQQTPPRLRLDEASKRITVGAREVALDKLSAKTYDMLRYLYHQENRVVSKADLYFLAYLGLDYIPQEKDDKNYDDKKRYEGLIDTNLHRLRQVIEPDPANPVLLVTVRGHGVKLQTRW